MYLLVNSSKIEETAKIEVSDEELISYYYRPITNFMGASDQARNRTMALFVDRPVGGTSRIPGQLEVIIERKALSSDWRGVAEITNDDYDCFLRYDLVFYSSSDPDRVRKDQSVNDLEALQMIGSVVDLDSISLPKPQIDETPIVSPITDCFTVDVMPVNRIPGYLEIQTTMINLCRARDTSTTLADVLRASGINPKEVSHVTRMTADGSLKYHQSSEKSSSLR